MRAFEERNAANLLVSLGNNDPTRGRAFAGSWNAGFGWLGKARVGVAGVLGDRDVAVRRGRYQFAPLDMPAPYYVRRLRDAEVIVLNSNAVDDVQTRWLQRTLARPAEVFRIVVLHHTPFSCGAYTGDAAVRERWVPLFRRYGVRLVLGGHERSYQRFGSGRTTYVVNGAGGEPTAKQTRCPKGYAQRRASESAQSFLYLTVDAGGVNARAVDMRGKTIDRFRVR
jgi:hypothetical protein